MKSRKVEFQIPKEFVMPEGAQPGETFSAVCDFELKDNGTCCLTTMGDAKMPGYDGNESEHRKGYDDYTKSMQTEMPSGGGY